MEEEEERELQEAMEKTAYTMYQEDLDFAHDVEVKRERMLSLGNVYPSSLNLVFNLLLKPSPIYFRSVVRPP